MRLPDGPAGRALPAGLLLLLVLAGCASQAERPGKVANRESSADLRRNLGLAEGYLAKGELDKAVEWTEKAIALDPAAAEPRALRALVYERAGDSDKAGKEFERALRLAPTDGNILNAHGAWLCEHGQHDAADRAFARALADSGYSMPHQALANAGKCALSAGRLAAAEDYLRRALVFAPTDAGLLYLLADVELRQGKAFEARAFIQRRDALGADRKTLDLAARIEDAAGDAQAAARYRARLRDQFPEHEPTGEGAPSP